MSGELISDANYYQWIEGLKQRYRSSQAKAAVSVNTELLRFYWSLGRDIVTLKAESQWGTGVVAQVSKDLQEAFPGVKGFSTTNIKYATRWFSFYYQNVIIGHQAVDQISHQLGDQLEMPEIFGQVPWRHHVEIFIHSKSIDEALFYINQVATNNWSRHTLEDKIKSGLYDAQGKAVTNFERELPADFAPKATALLKDPYCFDFLEMPDNYSERQLEDALVHNITRFIMEMGNGFAFVGRQVELRMPDGNSYFPDLLFYNYRAKCFTVCELKVTDFMPENVGKLNFYVKAVDELLRGDDDNPTIGLLICRSKNKTVVEWSLSDIHKPLGVASYELQKRIEASLNAMLNANDKTNR